MKLFGVRFAKLIHFDRCQGSRPLPEIARNQRQLIETNYSGQKNSFVIRVLLSPRFASWMILPGPYVGPRVYVRFCGRYRG